MSTEAQFDTTRYRLVITRRKASEILLSRKPCGASLPQVEVRSGARLAGQLIAQVRCDYHLETYCLTGEAINYHNFEYKPQDAEAKYFLSEFCSLYYRRNRYTIQDDFSKSLYFLDGKLANGIFDAYRKDDIIKKFITNTAAPEIDVDVEKVSLEGMQTPPYRATVDFYMVYYSPADHSELKRDLYTASFVFVFKSQVPNELIPINPLGLTITYFREDQAFK